MQTRKIPLRRKIYLGFHHALYSLRHARFSTVVILLLLTTLLTGAAVSFAGIIGFVDLIVPHVTRRVFGSRHRTALPMNALLGGGFMVLADLIARTVLVPRELPVGAITALVGAPFFAWIYFHRRGGRRHD